MDGDAELVADFLREFVIGDEDDGAKLSILEAIERETPDALARALWLGPLVRLDVESSAAPPPTIH